MPSLRALLAPVVPCVITAAIAACGLVAGCSDGASDGSSSPPAPSSSVAPTIPSGGPTGRPAPSHTTTEGYGSAPPPRCTSFTYTDWSVCHAADETRARTVVTSSPEGCVGGQPVVEEDCSVVAPTDGLGLYETYCASCHGDRMKGSSARDITAAIAGDVGGMSFLSDLTQDEIDLIAGIDSAHPR